MKKLTPQLQSGIEYIQLSRLPFKQMIAFKDWICETDKFVLTDPYSERQDCVYYDKYEFWFDTFKGEAGAVELSIF